MSTPTSAPTAFTADTYKANWVVETVHGFYHHDQDDFDSGDSDYKKSIAYMFVGCAAIGVIACIFSLFWNACSTLPCCRICCTCCFKKQYGACGRYFCMFMYILAGVVILATYQGRTEMMKAIDNSVDVLNDIGDIFSSLEDDGDDLGDASSDFTTYSASSACSGGVTAQLENYASSFASGSSTLSSLFDGLDSKMYRAADLFEGYSDTYLTNFWAGLCALVWSLVIWSIISICTTKCKCDDCIKAFLGALILLIITAVLAVLLTFNMGLADFCYADPAVGLISAGEENLKLDDDQVNIIEYYATCDGDNPFAASFNATFVAMKSLNDTLADQSVRSLCDTTSINKLQAATSTATTALSGIKTSFQCSNINPHFIRVLHKVLCQNLVDGLFYFWTPLAFSGLILFINMIITPPLTYDLPDDEYDYDDPNSPKHSFQMSEVSEI